MKNQILRSIGGGIAAALLLAAAAAQGEDLPLGNPDFAEGLAGWTASGLVTTSPAWSIPPLQEAISIKLFRPIPS
ncbi:MAG: hypothetical protein ACKOEM_23095, partial [Planctomycetia bacterium]